MIDILYVIKKIYFSCCTNYWGDDISPGKRSGMEEITEPGDEFQRFEATIINQGDKVLDAKLFLAIANMTTMEEYQMKSTNVTLYPDQSRKVVLTLDKKLTPGKYAIAYLMDYGHRSSIEGSQLLLDVE